MTGVTSNASTATSDFFWKRVKVGDSKNCWPWLGGVNEKGYGRIKHGGREWKAHRLAYTLAIGPIPRGQVVRHRCDYPRCCNPAHLELGTVAENNQDCIKRGRHVSPSGMRNGKTKLTDKQVAKIRLDPRSGAVIARDYGVSQTLVSYIRRDMRRA